MTVAPVPFERLVFEPVPGPFAVMRLDPAAPVPGWTDAARGLVSITRTDDELSIVAPEHCIPDDTSIPAIERGWTGWRVKGTLEFELIGILAAITTRLADAGVSAFAISTFDTDYVLVKERDQDTAATALNIN